MLGVFFFLVACIASFLLGMIFSIFALYFMNGARTAVNLLHRFNMSIDRAMWSKGQPQDSEEV